MSNQNPGDVIAPILGFILGILAVGVVVFYWRQSAPNKASQPDIIIIRPSQAV